MVYRVVLMFALSMSISACGADRKSVLAFKPDSFELVYAQSLRDARKDAARFIQERLVEQKSLGWVEPYVPIMRPPVVRKVWVPDHPSAENSDILVGGHWVYVVLEGPRWHIEPKERAAQVPALVPGLPAPSSSAK